MTTLARTPPARGSRGFTLVELMVAMSFFGVMMLGLLSLFPLGSRSVQKSEKLTIATRLAEDELERLKNLPSDDADLTDGTHVDLENPILGVYTRTWTVTDDTPLPGMTTVDLNVLYTNDGLLRNVNVKTYFAR